MPCREVEVARRRVCSGGRTRRVSINERTEGAEGAILNTDSGRHFLREELTARSGGSRSEVEVER